MKSIGMPGFSMAGGLDAGARAHRALHARAVDLLQRHARRRSRGRHRDRAGDDPALRRDARLRPRHQSDGGGRAGDRRRRARRRQRALRAHGLRRATRSRSRPTSASTCCRSRPTCRDVESRHMETPSPLNPLGIKGAGEGGTIPAIAAIVAGGRERARAVRRAHRRGADHAGADRGAAGRSDRRPSPPILIRR